MNRNSYSRFSQAPQVEISRSKFTRDSNLKTSFNVGDLIPIYCDEVLPGDTFSMDTAKVLRLQTLITPVMDNLYCDIYYFFVPNRLVWEHWPNLMGENSDSAWIPQVQYSVPQLNAPSGGWNIGTLADYFGIPTGVDMFSVNAMPFRSYALIVDEWFRDQNLQQPVNIPLGDSAVTGANTGNYITDLVKGGLPFKANKYHDYFTSCLPSPQKAPDVILPIGNSAPVYPLNQTTTYDVGDTVPSSFRSVLWNAKDSNGKFALPSAGDYMITSNGSGGLSSGSPGNALALYPMNLFADLANATGNSINQLRSAFQIQRLYEKDARGGSRYRELLASHFGVTSPDSRLQRPEYLGGNRFPLNVQQVSQTSSTDATTPQGNVTGYSHTSDVNHDFVKSFTEHGFIIGLACARYEHSYQQGVERFWNRETRFDFFWPALAHVGEQAVKNREIFLTSNGAQNIEVFGYQEAWADYRFKPNRISGQMRSAANGALDSWHFADDYVSLPYLSASWISEDKSNIDRALAVTSSTAHQIFGDFYFSCQVTRPMPLYSVPGLIDHF